eukprot:RCo022173
MGPPVRGLSLKRGREEVETPRCLFFSFYLVVLHHTSKKWVGHSTRPTTPHRSLSGARRNLRDTRTPARDAPFSATALLPFSHLVGGGSSGSGLLWGHLRGSFPLPLPPPTRSFSGFSLQHRHRCALVSLLLLEVILFCVFFFARHPCAGLCARFCGTSFPHEKSPCFDGPLRVCSSFAKKK